MKRKSILLVVVFALIFSVGAFAGCNGNENDPPETYTLSYSAGANGTVTGTLSQTVEKGKNGTEVTAVPNDGYVFSKWSDSVTETARTDKNVTANISVTAEFTADFVPNDGLDDLRAALADIETDMQNVRINSAQTADEASHDAIIEADGNILFASQYWGDELSEHYLEITQSGKYMYCKDLSGEWFKEKLSGPYDEMEIFVIFPTCLDAGYFRAEGNGFVMKEDSVPAYLEAMEERCGGNVIFIDEQKPLSVSVKVNDGKLSELTISFVFAEDGRTVFKFVLTFSDYGEISLTLPDLSEPPNGLDSLRAALANIEGDISNAKLTCVYSINSVDIGMIIETDGNVYHALQSMGEVVILEDYIETTANDRYDYEKNDDGTWRKSPLSYDYCDLDLFIVLPQCLDVEYFRAEDGGFVMKEESYSAFSDAIGEFTDGGMNLNIDLDEPFSLAVKVSDGSLSEFEIYFVRGDSEGGEGIGFSIKIEFSDYGEISLTLPDMPDELEELRTALANIESDMQNVRLTCPQRDDQNYSEMIIETDGNKTRIAFDADGFPEENYFEETDSGRYMYQSINGEWKKHLIGSITDIDMYFIFIDCLSPDYFRPGIGGYYMKGKSFAAYAELIAAPYIDTELEFTADLEQPFSVDVTLKDGYLTSFILRFTATLGDQTQPLQFEILLSDYGEISLTLPEIS